MGVHGLWNLLKDAGRPLDPKALEGKVIAVDISIWLNMAVKGARDYHGNNAMSMHLISLFHRICKLLHMGIKPVFVFDGSAPEIKRRTIEERKTTRRENKKESDNVKSKLMQNFLKKQALEFVSEEVKDTNNEEKQKKTKIKTEPKLSKLSRNDNADDIYKLPPLSAGLDLNSELDDLQDDHGQYDYAHYDIVELNSMKYEDKEFQMLPDEMQYELLRDIKEVKKRRRTKIEAMPTESSSFSMYQIAGLLDKNKITKKMEGVEKRMSTRQIRDVDSSSLMDLFESTSQKKTVEKVFTHNQTNLAVLIHTETKKVKDEKPASEDDESLCPIKTSMSLKRDKRVLSEKQIALKLKNKIDTEVKMPSMSESESSESEDGVVNFKEDNFGKLNIPTRATVSNDYDDIEHNQNICGDITAQKESENINKQKQEISINFKNKLTSRAINTDEIEKIGLIKHESNISDVAESNDKNFDNLNNILHVDKKGNSLQENNIQTDQCNKTTDPVGEGLTEPQLISSESEEEFEEMIAKTTDSPKIDLDQIGRENELNLETPLLEKSLPNNQHEETINPWKDDNVSNLESLQASLNDEASQLQDLADAKQRASREVTNSAQSECKELLTLFGIPFVLSPEEAEAQCAALESVGLCSGTITDDSDVWLFGGKFVVKDMFNGKRTPLMFDIKDIEDHLKLNRDKMICIAICSGSDYTSGISTIGPKTSVEILNEFGDCNLASLKSFKEWCINKDNAKEISNKKLLKFRKIKMQNTFPSEAVVKAYLEPVVDQSNEPFQWGTPDLEGLRDFAAKSMGWSRQKMNETLLPVIKKMAQYSPSQNKPAKSQIRKRNKIMPKKKENIKKFFKSKPQNIVKTVDPVLSEESDSD